MNPGLSDSQILLSSIIPYDLLLVCSDGMPVDLSWISRIGGIKYKS